MVKQQKLLNFSTIFKNKYLKISNFLFIIEKNIFQNGRPNSERQAIRLRTIDFFCIILNKLSIKIKPPNLVIQKEPHAPRIDEPTGEPESLYGRIDPKQMGVFAAREKPKKPQQNPQKKRKKQNEAIFNPKKKTKIVSFLFFELFSSFISENCPKNI